MFGHAVARGDFQQVVVRGARRDRRAGARLRGAQGAAAAGGPSAAASSGPRRAATQGVSSSAAADIVEHIAERAAAGAAGAGAPRGSAATFDGSDALDEQYVDALGDDEHDTQAAAAGEALGL
eukprot:2681159-Pyramimonas_sp.AAC.1